MSVQDDTALEDRRRDEIHLGMIMLGVATFIMLVFGLVMVYSATAPSSINNMYTFGEGSLFSTANSQLLYGTIGILLCAVAMSVPLRWYKTLAPLLLVFGLVLQVLVRTPLGLTVAGNTNWLKLGPFTLQPSEFLKLALIVFLAADLAKFRPGKDYKAGYMKWSGVAALASIGAVMLGGDLGTALVFVLIVVAMFWVSGGPGKYLLWLGGFGVFGIAAVVAYQPSRLRRISDWASNIFNLPDIVEPSQVDFALWAFGSGGLFGRGLGTGTEKWPSNLAEAQTDFIFAVIGEEFGLAGCLVVMILFVIMGLALLKIARNHTSRFGTLVTVGVAIWLCGQALANMLVVTGVLPVFGVPLPFSSVGGSALIASLLAIGLSLSSALDVPGVRESFHVRLPLARRAQATLSGGSDE